MKRTRSSLLIAFFFLFALLILGLGIAALFKVIGSKAQVALELADYDQWMTWLKAATFRLTIGGSMIATGLCLLLFLCAHLLCRTSRIRKEAAALRQKNEAMEALNQQAQKLAHHQRLQTIGTLTSSIAHEFNNLLTPIMGYSMMALEKLPPEEEEVYDNILEIYQASRKAKDIISRLSDLARKNPSVAFRPVCVDELIRKTLDVATPAQPLKVEIKLDLNCWDQRILANEIQISQMILNLVLNGFHAMGEQGGVLTISTSFDEDNVQIRIADTGCGIPEENLTRVFEPFFTTKDAGKGTGLGLAIVAQIVEDHHGEIRLQSRVGEGACFVITLPRNANLEQKQ